MDLGWGTYFLDLPCLDGGAKKFAPSLSRFLDLIENLCPDWVRSSSSRNKMRINVIPTFHGSIYIISQEYPLNGCILYYFIIFLISFYTDGNIIGDTSWWNAAGLFDSFLIFCHQFICSNFNIFSTVLKYSKTQINHNKMEKQEQDKSHCYLKI